MVVVNQIDDVDSRRIQAGLDNVQQKLDLRAIAASAKTGQNIQEVAIAASSGVQLLTLAGTVGGIAIATIATHGLALPILLGASGVGGGIAGAITGVLNGIFKRKRILDMEPEARRLKEFISTVHRSD